MSVDRPSNRAPRPKGSGACDSQRTPATPTPTPSPPHRRAGLAPLELVLALPLFLFVTALIVNFGDGGRWKIRAQGNARYAATRTLAFRSGEFDPNPVNWPLPAALSHAGANDITSVDPPWNSDPDITTPAVRGPMISDPWVGASITVKRELEMRAGVHNGRAQVTRRYHQAHRIMPNGGVYSFDLNQPLLDHAWNFGDMGYNDNQDRRARLWYAIEPDELGLSGLQGNLDAAHGQLQANPSQMALRPLDEDDEFIIYRGFPPPDFHPSPGGCELEADMYRQMPQYAGPSGFLAQIRRRPGVMARAFIGLYRAEIARQQGSPPQIPPQPPPPGGEHWTILEVKVGQLQSFLNSLPQQYQ